MCEAISQTAKLLPPWRCEATLSMVEAVLAKHVLQEATGHPPTSTSPLASFCLLLPDPDVPETTAAPGTCRRSCGSTPSTSLRRRRRLPARSRVQPPSSSGTMAASPTSRPLSISVITFRVRLLIVLTPFFIIIINYNSKLVVGEYIWKVPRETSLPTRPRAGSNRSRLRTSRRVSPPSSRRDMTSSSWTSASTP